MCYFTLFVRDVPVCLYDHRPNRGQIRYSVDLYCQSRDFLVSDLTVHLFNHLTSTFEEVKYE